MKSWQKLALLSAAYFALRIPLLDTPFIPDEFFFSSDYLTAIPDPFSRVADPAAGYWAVQWQRQLAVHPPFLSFFYFLWTGIFGDSLLSIRIPALLCGLAGIFFCCFLADRLPGEKCGFWCALMLSACGAHIHYSVTAVYAIFELTTFLGALLALAVYSERKSGAVLLYCALIGGALVSYHFIVFMMLSSVFLLSYRRRIPLPRAYVGLCAVFSILIAVNACQSWKRGIYDTFHYRMISVSTLASWTRELPDQILRYGREAL